MAHYRFIKNAYWVKCSKFQDIYHIHCCFMAISFITLKLPITTIVVCLVICLWFKVIFANSVDPDQTAPRGAIWSVHTVCQYAKIDLKSLQEYSADNRQHFQVQVFLAFEGLRGPYIYGKYSNTIQMPQNLIEEQSDQDPHCLPVCKNRLEKFSKNIQQMT